MCDVWRTALHARSPGRIPADIVSYLHDPLTVATIVDRRNVSVERLPVTVAMYRGVPRTFVDPVEGREAEVVTGVDADAFAEHWCDVVIGS
jgi:inosine-uridine nucleoside N-ribohydrolase